MIYIFAGYMVISGLIIGYLVWAVLETGRSAQQERKTLENRLMAICEPAALTHVDALEDEEPPNRVRYLDEEAGTSLQRGSSNAAEA